MCNRYKGRQGKGKPSKNVQTKAMHSKRLCIGAALMSLCVAFTVAAKPTEFHVTLQDHVFIPSIITIPANTKVKLIIHNQDNTIEEFDSFDLNREKVLFPGKAGRIFIGPLPPGRYQYFGEYFPNSARGTVIVEARDVN